MLADVIKSKNDPKTLDQTTRELIVVTTTDIYIYYRDHKTPLQEECRKLRI